VIKRMRKIREFKPIGNGNEKVHSWYLVKKFINNVKINETFTRQGLFNGIRNLKTRFFYQCIINEPTIDVYRLWLTSSKFIEKTDKPKIYKKLQHIPEDLTTVTLRKYLCEDTWRKWFIPREDYLGIKE
jgi:hypothetical protein